MGHLSDEERERANRFTNEPARNRFVAGRASLRIILSQYLYVTPSSLRFSAGAHGKLALADNALSFNLSHAGDYALIAVALAAPIGVDIEKMSASRNLADIAARFFSPAEQAALTRMEEGGRIDLFFRIWSRKEAVIKALGEGLACPLASFDVSADDDARLLAFRRVGIDAHAWFMMNIDAAPDYCGALAVIGSCKRVTGFAI
jgi:4'-phosphopantetheinyl transferase